MQECVRKGQSLASLARSLRTDMLSLYLSNPFVQRPEKLEPGAERAHARAFEHWRIGALALVCSMLTRPVLCLESCV